MVISAIIKDILVFLVVFGSVSNCGGVGSKSQIKSRLHIDAYWKYEWIAKLKSRIKVF